MRLAAVLDGLDSGVRRLIEARLYLAHFESVVNRRPLPNALKYLSDVEQYVAAALAEARAPLDSEDH
jgi:hypothetical protein